MKPEPDAVALRGTSGITPSPGKSRRNSGGMSGTSAPSPRGPLRAARGAVSVAVMYTTLGFTRAATVANASLSSSSRASGADDGADDGVASAVAAATAAGGVAAAP